MIAGPDAAGMLIFLTPACPSYYLQAIKCANQRTCSALDQKEVRSRYEAIPGQKSLTMQQYRARFM